MLGLLLITLASTSGCAGKQAPPPAPVAVAKPAPQPAAEVVEAAKSNLGVPYRFGGTSPETGFDCSGLVCWVYERVGVQLPRRARDQLNAGTKIRDKENLRPGDIVVFKDRRSRSGWHSGIYSGNGMFVHSPTSGKQVTESSINDAYFARRFAGASRVLENGDNAVGYARSVADPAGYSGLMTAQAEPPQTDKAVKTSRKKAGKAAPTLAAKSSGKKSKQAVRSKKGAVAQKAKKSKPGAPKVAKKSPAPKAKPSAAAKPPRAAEPRAAAGGLYSHL